MGEEVVSAVINKVVDIAATLIMEESSRLYWLSEEIRWLERQMRLMQAYLQHAEAYLQHAEAKKVTNPTVVTFTKGIRDLAHEVEDILDIFLPQIQEHKSNNLLKKMTCILPYSVTRCKFSREIEKIRKRVQEIEEDKKIYNIPDINLGDRADESSVDLRNTKLSFEDSLIVGFDEDIEKVKTKLNEHQFVTIVGMAGLGKTTLAKKVFKSVKDDFNCSASVSVSQDPNIKAILQGIATQVGLEKKKQDENLEVNLRALLQEKRYIILFDDVWSNEIWDRLRELLPVSSDQSASRIIITSRNKSVGRYLGCEDSLHFLHPFDEPTSWELFSKLIIPFFRSAEGFQHSELKKIGEQIVKKCGGVPLAIVVTIGMLREREKSEFCWNDVLNSIGHDTSDKCFQILSLSYIDLPTALKPCFLYFGNFPEDYEFSASKLIRMWVAEKLVLGNQARDPEDVGKRYMSNLDARNLIQVVERGVDGRVKKFRVHDLLYSLCVEKGREFGFLNIFDCIEPTPAMKVRRLGIFGSAVLNYAMPNVRGLFYFKFNRAIQQKNLKNMLGMLRLVRVLSFETSLGTVFYLPVSIGSLSCLNYVYVKGVGDRVEIPLSIQNLKNLETLIVRAYVIKVPVGIWKMEQFKHLYLKAKGVYCHRSHESILQQLRGLWPQVQVSLPNIQTLALPINYCQVLPATFTNLRKFRPWGEKSELIKVLCGREPISKNLETLHCVTVDINDINRDRPIRMNLSKYDMLTNLSISCFYGGDVLELQDHDLPPSLIKITFLEVVLSNSTVETLRKLPKLKILHLKYARFGRKFDCSGGFLQLEVLKLSYALELEEMIEGQESGMPKLRQLIIKDCPNLTIIPERLQQLRKTN